MEYPFKLEEFPSLALDIMVESLAYTQASNAVLIDELYGIDKAEQLKSEINALTLVLKNGILSRLYEERGSTPNL